MLHGMSYTATVWHLLGICTGRVVGWVGVFWYQ